MRFSAVISLALATLAVAAPSQPSQQNEVSHLQVRLLIDSVCYIVVHLPKSPPVPRQL